MKLLIVIALIGMVSAVEEVQPVVLPKAPAPEYETGVPVVEPIDISLLIVPQEVVADLQKLQSNNDISDEFPVNSVHFVDNANDISDDVPVSSVRFVDNTDDISDEFPVNSDRMVDNTNDISDDVPVSSVRFVDNADDISDDVPVSSVRFVDSADDISDDVPVSSVRFVDNAEDMPSDTAMVVEHADESPIPVNNFEKIAESELDSIRVVDIPVVPQDEKVQETVEVVDSPLSDDVPRVYPGKTYPDPTWR